jgi:hypothetical protein
MDDPNGQSAGRAYAVRQAALRDPRTAPIHVANLFKNSSRYIILALGIALCGCGQTSPRLAPDEVFRRVFGFSPSNKITILDSCYLGGREWRAGIRCRIEKTELETFLTSLPASEINPSGPQYRIFQRFIAPRLVCNGNPLFHDLASKRVFEYYNDKDGTSLHLVVDYDSSEVAALKQRN